MQQMPPAQPYNAVPHGSGSCDIVQVPAVTTTYDRYKSRTYKIIGVAQMILGSLCILFNIVEVVFMSYGVNFGMGVIGHGIWCGILFIVTGGLGLGAGARRTKCLIISFMVLCIISASVTSVLLSFGIIGSAIAGDTLNRCRYYGFDYGSSYFPPCEEMDRYRVIASMEALLAIAGVIEAIVAIWGSVVCCKSGVCCCPRQTLAYSSPWRYRPLADNSQMTYVTQTQGGAQCVFAPQPMNAWPQGMNAPPSDVRPRLTGPPPPAAGHGAPLQMYQADPSYGYDQSKDVDKQHLYNN